MVLSYGIGSFLVIMTLVAFGITPGHPLRADDPSPTVILQTITQQYVTLLPFATASGSRPWLIYPTNSTIWVVGITTGNQSPPSSQLMKFLISGVSKPVLNLTNVFVNSILADPSNPEGKVWFTENSTLAFYDSIKATETRAITFQGQSIQYLTSDSKGRIWMSAAGSSGASVIAMYDPIANSTLTYPVRASNAIVQGLTVASSGDSIWFAEAGSKKIGRLLLQSSSFTEYSPPANINLAAPVQLALDSSGNVWFTDHGTNQFGEFIPQSNVWKVYPIGYCDQCARGLPNAIFVDSKNIIWFSEHIAGRVGRFDPSTGILTEYPVPGRAYPGMWWAMPGPKNLVWFVAWESREIGYVNASIPVRFFVSGPSPDVVVQRGGIVGVPIQTRPRSATTLSFGVSPVTLDQPLGSPAQVYGSSPSDLSLGNSSQTVSFSVSAAWNASLGPRYVALTASDGQVAVSAHVRIVVVESSVPFVAVGFSSLIILGSLTLYIRRPRKPTIQPSKKMRR